MRAARFESIHYVAVSGTHQSVPGNPNSTWLSLEFVTAVEETNPPLGMLAWTGATFIPGLPEPVKNRALTEIGGEPYDPQDPMAQMIEAGTEHYQAALPQPGVLTEQQLAALEVPTYVAIGEHSSLAGGQRAVEGASALPDATVEVWPDTTHSLPMQAGEPLNRVVLEHIDDNDGGQ